MARPFRTVDLSAVAYGPMTKDTAARLYVVPLEDPIRIVTTPVTLASDIGDPDVPFVYASVDSTLNAFLTRVEDTIADACIANKNEWFAIAKTLEDDVLRRGFKSFRDADKGWKFKVPEDLACFSHDKKPIGREDLRVGDTVRLALELTRVCFGKHEYGASWKVLQVQTVQTECLIPPDESPFVDDVIDDISSDIDA